MQVQHHSIFLPLIRALFPLDLHALPLGSLDRACPQVELAESIREDGSATYLHTRPISGWPQC